MSALKDFWIFLAVLAGIAVTILATKLAIFLVEWKQELDYINMELNRCDGDERIHWEHEKRRHLRRIFPFLKKVEGDEKKELTKAVTAEELPSAAGKAASPERRRYGSDHSDSDNHHHSDHHHSSHHHGSHHHSSHHHGSRHHSSGESDRHHSGGSDGSGEHLHVSRHPRMK